MSSILNGAPNLGANFAPNMAPNMPPNIAPNVAPMPTYTAPAYGYACPAPVCCPSYGNDFILIVVLFILLIIVGASFYCKC
jgi:uncharacterized protein (TIGR01732 family)